MSDNETRIIEQFLEWLIMYSPFWIVDGEDDAQGIDTVLAVYGHYRETDDAASPEVQP